MAHTGSAGNNPSHTETRAFTEPTMNHTDQHPNARDGQRNNRVPLARNRRRSGACLLLAWCASTVTATFASDDYPNRPIRMVVPVSAGSSADSAARAFSQKLADILGRPIAVDNRVGAGGRIGAGEVARATADGYTLLYGTSITQALYPAIGQNVTYDPLKDFVALGQTFWFATVIACNAQVPFKDFKGMLAYARANPGKLTFANSGTGGGNHFGNELLATLADIKLHHVPFRGNAPGIQAVLGNVVDCTSQTEVKPYVDSGQLRALATTGKERDPRFPDLPTVEEAGVPGYVTTWWHAVYAPAGTPAPVLRKLETAVRTAAQDRAVYSKLASIGLVPMYMTPEQVTQRTRTDIDTFKRIAKESAIQLD